MEVKKIKNKARGAIHTGIVILIIIQIFMSCRNTFINFHRIETPVYSLQNGGSLRFRQDSFIYRKYSSVCNCYAYCYGKYYIKRKRLYLQVYDCPNIIDTVIYKVIYRSSSFLIYPKKSGFQEEAQMDSITLSSIDTVDETEVKKCNPDIGHNLSNYLFFYVNDSLLIRKDPNSNLVDSFFCNRRKRKGVQEEVGYYQ